MKHDFRTKLDGDSRAVSYRNIEASLGYEYFVDVKGIKTMIRQYLKSMYKNIYAKPISFKYYKSSNGLDVYIDNITGDELREITTKFDQFTSGSVLTDVTRGKLITFGLRSLAVLNGTPSGKPSRKPSAKPTSAPQSNAVKKLKKIQIWKGGVKIEEFDNWKDANDYFYKVWSDSRPYSKRDFWVEVIWDGIHMSKKVVVDSESKKDIFQTFLYDYFYPPSTSLDKDWITQRDTLQWTDNLQSPQSQSTPAPQLNGLPKQTRIYIHTHEGTGEFDNMIFKTWSDLQNALKKIYDNWSKNPYGYDKVKIEIEWENGKHLLDRVDVGNEKNGDFNPNVEFIGDYIKKQDGSMFSSNFDKRPSPNDRDSVSWQDETQTQSAQAPQSDAKIPVSKIELYNYTGEKLIKSFKNWDDADIYLEGVWKKMKNNTFKEYSVQVIWDNGESITEKVILSAEEYYPDGSDSFNTTFLYNWLYSCEDAQSLEDKDKLDWGKVNESQQSTPQSTPTQSAPHSAPQSQPQNQNQTMNNNYILTKEEMQSVYGLEWREFDKLDWIDELDYLLGHTLSEMEQTLLKSGAKLSVEIDGLDINLPIEATTLACYHDYDDLSADEIDEIVNGLEIYLNLGVGTTDERKNANALMQNLKLFKKHNK